MTDAEILLGQIEEACRRLGIAQTTFGRHAVNDGKLVSRLQQGGRVTLDTVNRVHRFIAERGGPAGEHLRSAIKAIGAAEDQVEGFRFYDNRQKYLMFVNTTSEKRIIADKALEQLMLTQPEPPAIRLFDGGTGDGSALVRLLRGAHRRYPWLPFYVVAKEISIENVLMALDKMPDRFQEHPATLLVVTNLNYTDAPHLRPASPIAAGAMTWHEVPLEGATAGDFEEAIAGLQPFVDRHWQVKVSQASGHPVTQTPTVLVIYRRDQRFVLDSVIPRRGAARADFDFVLLSHPYRARAPIGFKARKVVAPLVRALRPNGRLLGIHALGRDPGLDLVRSIWPGEDPFVTGRTELMAKVAEDLGGQARGFEFHDLPDAEALFRYSVRMHDTELAPGGEPGMSTLLAAWNAASYVAQIEDNRLSKTLGRRGYVEATRAILEKNHGLWFSNESYIISRRADLGAQ